MYSLVILCHDAIACHSSWPIKWLPFLLLLVDFFVGFYSVRSCCCCFCCCCCYCCCNPYLMAEYARRCASVDMTTTSTITTTTTTTQQIKCKINISFQENESPRTKGPPSLIVVLIRVKRRSRLRWIAAYPNTKAMHFLSFSIPIPSRGSHPFVTKSRESAPASLTFIPAPSPPLPSPPLCSYADVR